MQLIEDSPPMYPLMIFLYLYHYNKRPPSLEQITDYNELLHKQELCQFIAGLPPQKGWNIHRFILSLRKKL